MPFLFHISKLLRKLVSRMPIIASLTESLLTFGTFYFMHMIWNNGFRLGWPFTENLPLLKFSFDLRFNFKRHSGIYLVVSTEFLLHNRSLPLAEISGRHLLPTNYYLKVLGRGARFQDYNCYLHIAPLPPYSAACPIPPQACARQSKGSESLKTT